MKRKAKRLQPDATNLTLVRKKIERWRDTRKKGSRIPDKLWEAAAQLVCAHGLSPVTTALKLNYYDLKRRVQGLEPPTASTPMVQTPKFVEVSLSSHPTPSNQAASVEISRRNGERLSLQLSTVDSEHLRTLLQTFLRS